MMNRRRLLQRLGVAALAAQMPQAVLAQSPYASVGIRGTRTDLGGGLMLLGVTDRTNVVVAEGPDSVVIVGGSHPDNADALLRQIRDQTNDKPVSALFNLNWRRDNCGLNTILGPQSTPIIAHENTRLWQNAEFRADWQDADYTPWAKNEQANQTFYTNGSLALGAETIEYGIVGQCSTDGDIWVHFKNADVLVVGDMLAVDHYLLLDYVTGGWINGAQRTTTALTARATDTTKVIAARGGVYGKAELAAQQALLDHAYNEVAKAYQNGRSLQDFLAADPMAAYREQLGDPTLFLTLLYKGTWYHVPGRAVRNII